LLRSSRADIGARRVGVCTTYARNAIHPQSGSQHDYVDRLSPRLPTGLIWQCWLAILPFLVGTAVRVRGCVKRARARQSILAPLGHGILESCPSRVRIRRFRHVSYVNRINCSNSSEFEKLPPKAARGGGPGGLGELARCPLILSITPFVRR